MNKYLVTSALPYANGKLHIGHVAGAYIPADIFVRYLKLKGEDVVYICGTDEHGAPISIRAEAEGKTPQEIVDYYHQSIKKSFDGISVEFDNFSGTARPKHHELSQQFFLELLNNGFINEHITQQLYCEHDKRFLPDRYVEGQCYHCGAEGARGDQCDACGKLIDATLLVKPQCKICGNTPIVKETKHWFLNLPKFAEPLKAWLDTKESWKDNVLKFILSWIEDGLIERSITRDINWGVKIPVADTEGKVLYVWFDAPIGYISSSIEWAERIGQPDRWKDYWYDENTKLVHFIGKDNIPFHAIIWPSILMGQKQKYILPHDIPANEYLTLEGDKISTSRNWAIWVEDFLKYYDGELLRYCLSANAPETKDADFSWKDFQTRVNSELANILGNLVNRVLSFSHKNYDGVIPFSSDLSDYSKQTIQEVREIAEEIDTAYREYKVRKASKLCMDIARIGNKYFDEMKPWACIKEDKEKTKETLFVCGEILKVISIVFAPIIPQGSAEIREMMSCTPAQNWDDIFTLNESAIKINKITTMYRKIEDAEIEAQINLLKEQAKANKADAEPQYEDKLEDIDFDDFMKLDLRIVKVLHAEKIKKSEKLLKLKVQCGKNEIQVLSGIAKYYEPEQLVGKEIVMLINLKPRKMMGEISEGMILSAHIGDDLRVLIPEKPIKNGAKIS
ncbi:MAG TPA: methionine--tRNA ligase [Candidatus Cloacimonadota bacterium]|nr:methionine--tRNA ligase [Candidatus Cloacimonadota bacterium]HQB40882.1 methionine--tRNA ligase [Candidatus Cloacimonadota bacterium]